MRLAFIAPVALLAACSRSAPPEAPTVLSARQGLSATPPASALAVGEDCSAYEGNGACASGLCLRVKPGLPPTGFCSIRCRPGDDEPCPDGPGEPWICAQAFPSPEGWVCAPPRKWASGRATWKGGPVPVRVPPMVVAALVPDAGALP